MEAKFISKEGNDVTFTMFISAEEFEASQNEAYRKTKNRYSVNGFRKGKAPRRIIEQHYGEGVFIEEAMEDLLQEHYPKALAALEIEPIDRPDIDFGEISKGEGFTVTAVVATPPEVEVKDYTGISIKSVAYKVGDEDVERDLESIRRRNARLVESEGAAKDGDTLAIDYVGTVDGEAFDGGSAEDYNLKLGSNQFIPGFEEQLVGASKDSEVTVNVKFPEDYHAENLKGKDAVFQVKVKGIKTEEKPEINDEFAQDVSEFETLAELKDDIRKKLTESAEKRTENEQKNAVLEVFYNANEIEIPEIMVKNQIDDMVNEYSSNLRRQGMDLNMYINYMGQKPEEFRESLRDDAFKRVKMRLLIKAVAKAENFDVTDDELENEFSMMAGQYGMDLEKLKENLGDDQIGMLKEDIRNRKAVDYMLEMAVIEHSEPEETKKDAEDVKAGDTTIEGKADEA